MATLLVSDVHLRGVGDPNQTAFIEFLETVSFDELVIVGDLFDVWFTFGSTVYLDFVPVIGVLERLVRSGRPVTWVAGNHDWAPGVQPLGIQVTAEYRTAVGSRGVLAVHGDDGADPRLRNRLLQRGLRSRTAGRLARVLGPDRVRSVGQRIAGQGKHHRAGLFDVLARQGRLVDGLLADADVVCTGHSHAPGMLPRPGGTWVNLGDWLDHRSFARLDDDAIRLLRWADGEEVPLPQGPPQRWPWAASRH